jgi:hypothetical protein
MKKNVTEFLPVAELAGQADIVFHSDMRIYNKIHHENYF